MTAHENRCFNDFRKMVRHSNKTGNQEKIKKEHLTTLVK